MVKVIYVIFMCIVVHQIFSLPSIANDYVDDDDNKQKKLIKISKPTIKNNDLMK